MPNTAALKETRHHSLSCRELLTGVVRMIDILLTGIGTHKDLRSSTREER